VSFNSVQYAAFLAVVFALFWTLPRRHRPTLLLVASILFYASWGPVLVVALLAVSGVTWLAARAIRRTDDPGRRKLLCGLAVAWSLGVAFGLRVLGTTIGGATEGSTPTAFGGVAARAIIPVGLAFITFQAISYVVDTYRDPVATPDASLPDHVLYVAFFPHLLAGPVMRARRLVPSFHEGPDRPSKPHLYEGAELLLVGLFKKVAIADPAFLIIAREGADPSVVPSGEMWLLWLLGLAAAYFDITGYIDMARGSARLLAIDLHPNAAQPLLRSTELADFWRRWQVTVMAWFRDYVFLPVRGAARTRSREALALMTVFVSLAVWHGTSLNWLVWGVLTGTIVVVERELQGRRSARARAGRSRGRGERSALGRAGRLLYVYVALILTLPWIGSPTVSATLDTYRALLGFRGGGIDGDTVGFLLLAVASLLLLDGRERVRQARSGRPDPPTPLRALGFGAMVVAIVIFSGASTQPFIYLRF
jgi:D-alanyl-lipoteichoic acid acyltransferase DltB (MBOAT superfamily)